MIANCVHKREHFLGTENRTARIGGDISTVSGDVQDSVARSRLSGVAHQGSCLLPLLDQGLAGVLVQQLLAG